MTPAPIAADIIFTAYQWGDIENKTVVDLGCGTGIFSVGAVSMGAKKVLVLISTKTSSQQQKSIQQKPMLSN